MITYAACNHSAIQDTLFGEARADKSLAPGPEGFCFCTCQCADSTTKAGNSQTNGIAISALAPHI